MFKGVATTGRLAFGDGGPDQTHVFTTIGAFPILHDQLKKQLEAAR